MALMYCQPCNILFTCVYSIGYLLLYCNHRRYAMLLQSDNTKQHFS